jgi:hypothetical protein
VTDLLDKKRSLATSVDLPRHLGWVEAKDVFVAREMASPQIMAENLSRAVLQIVRQSEIPESVYGLTEERRNWRIALAQQAPYKLRPRRVQVGLKRNRHQIVRRLLKVLQEVQGTRSESQVTTALEDLLSSWSEGVERSTESFLNHARRLADRGHIDAALDIIYDQVDEMLLAGKFDDVDHLLGGIDVGMLSVDLLIGILTATLPARQRLANRPLFYARVEQALTERGELKTGLLEGLA